MNNNEIIDRYFTTFRVTNNDYNRLLKLITQDEEKRTKSRERFRKLNPDVKHRKERIESIKLIPLD